MSSKINEKTVTLKCHGTEIPPPIEIPLNFANVHENYCKTIHGIITVFPITNRQKKKKKIGVM